MKIEAVSPPARTDAIKAERSVPLLVWALVVFAIIALPFRILYYGYLPNDDALRHAAKAVSGKPWSEIILLRPEVTIDHNPGWHVILGALHRVFHWDAQMLVQFSVVTMFALFGLAPVGWLRRPEAWLASVAVLTVAFPYLADRAFIGRPLFVTMAVTLILLSIWTRPLAAPTKRNSWLRLGVTTVLMTLSVWIHGSWYLLPLIPAAFFLARRWRESFLLGGCWLVAAVLGAALTGHPWQFLSQSVMIPFWALNKNAPREALVGEFLPMRTGYLPAIVITAAVLMWRIYSGRKLANLWRDPVFILALLGYVLGFRVVRFWLDWGLIAFALWLARELQELLPFARTSWLRVAVAFTAAVVLFAGIGADWNHRWTQYATLDCLDARRPEHAGWLPDRGGIIYSVDLSVFYNTFFTNPNGNWRYVMGFEPTFMRPEDLAVYYDLCRTHNAIRACAPWVRRMTPADRLILRGPPQRSPSIPELEWFYAAPNLWVGRLPRTAAG